MNISTEDYSRSGGFLGLASAQSNTSSKQLKNKGSDLLSSDNILVRAGATGDGGIVLQGSSIKSDRVDLQARIVHLASVLDSDEFSHSSLDNGLLLSEMVDKGHVTQEAARSIIAANSIYLNNEELLTGAFDDVLGSSAGFEAYIDSQQDLKASLASRGISVQSVLEQHDEWNVESTSLSQLARLAISIAVGSVTGGVAFGTSMAEQAASAVVNSMVDQLIVASIEVGITGNSAAFDIEAMLKSAAIAGATQFIGAHIDAEYEKSTGINLADKSGTVLERIKRNLPNDLLKGTANAAVITAVQGGSLSDNLVSGLRLSAAASIGEEIAVEIGSEYVSALGKDSNGQLNDPTAVQYLSHKLAHTMLGCAMGQIGSGDCSSGAAGGLGGAIVAEGYERLTYDEFKSEVDDLIQLSSTSGTGELSAAQAAQVDALFEDWRNRGVDLSRVSGAFFAAAAGGDAQLGAQTAANAAENNILPAVFLVARLGFMAYTAYELYETGKKIHNLAERYQNGEEISDEELQSAALELGIEAVTGVVTSKFKLLEKIVKAADGILKKTGLDTKVQKLLEKKSGNVSSTTTVANSKTSGDNTGVGGNRTFTTKIDSKITSTDHVALPEGIAKTFRNGEYATVKTNVDTPVYRKFGGGPDQAKVNGGFAGTEQNLGRNEIAVYPKWNSTQFEAEIIIPKGTQIHVGRVATQPVGASGSKYRGGTDQVLLPRDYPDTWIKSVRDGKTGKIYTGAEFKAKFPEQFN